MKFEFYRYDATVNIAGSPLHQVNKDRVSAAEIAVLRGLHGSDAVLIHRIVGKFRADASRVRDHLLKTYGFGAVLRFIGNESATLPSEAPIVVIPESVRVSISRQFEADEDEEMIEDIDRPTKIGAAVGFDATAYEEGEAVEEDISPPVAVNGKPNAKAATPLSA